MSLSKQIKQPMNNKWITSKNPIPQNTLTDVATEHCFNVILPGFEQIIIFPENNGFIQLEAKWLKDINYFSREPNKFLIIFA